MAYYINAEPNYRPGFRVSLGGYSNRRKAEAMVEDAKRRNPDYVKFTINRKPRV